jgi:GNAT superfamily N-acetyltransferase/8-oxo-dGTP pyrophosphatase MutT (NUDIX family)
MRLKLRAARAYDAPALTKIMHDAKAAWGYPEDLMRQWREHWQIIPEMITDHKLIVAEDAGHAIAFSGLKQNTPRSVTLEYLYVSPSAQKKGIGTLLLQRSEDRARQIGCDKVTLRCEVNAGVFYERRQYKTVGQEPSKMAPGRFMPLMEKTLAGNVVPISEITLSVSSNPWDFETDNAAEISAHFAEQQRRIPELWNGRTLKLTSHSFDSGALTGVCTECSYAAFLTWRDWGAPDLTTFNLFGSAVIRSSDGALLYGVMSAHTATAGQIYPPGGNLDPSDVGPTGLIDIRGAIARELEEETGLRLNDLVPDDLLIVFDGARISVAQVFDSDRSAEALRHDIIAHSMASDEKELADIRIIRSGRDLTDPKVASYARALGNHILR